MIWTTLFTLIGLGMVLLMTEIFLIPGFGITGIAGLISFLGGIGYALYLSSTGVLSPFLTSLFVLFSIIAVPAGIYFLGSRLKDSSLARKMILEESLDGEKGFRASNDELLLLYGERGETITALKPCGSAMIRGERVSVICEDGFLDKGVSVVVTNIEDNSVYVRRESAEASEPANAVSASRVSSDTQGESEKENQNRGFHAGA
ncbi:MAG: hypothetical protein CVV64_10675 [Candidatus Wallbacteria bacterium HGW-Wallbacteria-1]|jgi:membrane-bound serine protease (ClpP class)|uniref:Uncharacterized protein n=1 Tax=Candidatus Wallbacteria bacterium HGW-Wallbacteria-1 TaxID=2013854 RepID=A0A2N1PPC2_9BACT|nr:MAG: hypothetical protein CVV64_10675 [Candidatus Wallbacteria bacterium HGW-Wallbacteria-1]